MQIELLKKSAIYISKKRAIPHRMRRSIIKRLVPNFFRDHEFETRMEGGLLFSGNLSNHIDLMIYFCGVHEKYMLHFIRDALDIISTKPKEDIVFMDIGANVGNHTLYMAPMVKKVYAFEPFERLRKQLENNITSNNIQNVSVMPFGLSDKAENLPFYSGPESNLGTSSFAKTHSQDNKLLGKMDVFVGDDVVEQESIAKTHVIKIDVEGFEAQVLRGLKKTIERDHPLIIIELSLTTRDGLKNENEFKELFPEGYNFFYFKSGSSDSGKYELQPFSYDLMPKLQDVIAVPKDMNLDKLI